MTNEFIPPYSIVRDAACGFLCRLTSSPVLPEVLSLPGKYSDASTPILVRNAVYISNEEINAALGSNMPTYDDIGIFQSVSVRGGYVLFDVSNELLMSFAKKVAETHPVGGIADRILVPSSAEYAHARLIGYARTNEQALLTAKKHRALWLCLGLIEDDAKLGRRRLNAAVRATLEAFEPDAENGCIGCIGGYVASAMAALIYRAQGKILQHS